MDIAKIMTITEELYKNIIFLGSYVFNTELSLKSKMGCAKYKDEG